MLESVVETVVETSASRASEAAAPHPPPPSPLAGLNWNFSSAADVDLCELVGHRITVEASTKIEDVSRAFASAAVDFLSRSPKAGR